MPSPSGCFVGLSQSELLVMRANAIDTLKFGVRTSISGGAKSGSKEYPGDPYRDLIEVNYALRALGVMPPRPQKVYQIMNDQFCNRGAE